MLNVVLIESMNLVGRVWCVALSGYFLWVLFIKVEVFFYAF